MASLDVLRLLLTYNVTAGSAKMFRDRLDVRSQSQCKSRSVTLVPFPRAWYIRKPNLIAIGYVLFAMLMATYLWVMMAREIGDVRRWSPIAKGTRCWRDMRGGSGLVIARFIQL